MRRKERREILESLEINHLQRYLNNMKKRMGKEEQRSEIGSKKRRKGEKRRKNDKETEERRKEE